MEALLGSENELPHLGLILVSSLPKLLSYARLCAGRLHRGCDQSQVTGVGSALLRTEGDSGRLLIFIFE